MNGEKAKGLRESPKYHFSCFNELFIKTESRYIKTFLQYFSNLTLLLSHLICSQCLFSKCILDTFLQYKSLISHSDGLHAVHHSICCLFLHLEDGKLITEGYYDTLFLQWDCFTSIFTTHTPFFFSDTLYPSLQLLHSKRQQLTRSNWKFKKVVLKHHALLQVTIKKKKAESIF